MIKKTKSFTVLALFIMMILTFVSCNKKVKPFVEGDQRFIIKNYNLQQEGLLGLANILREHVEMPSLLSVDNFNANITEEGVVESFTLLLYGYNDLKEYTESYRFVYNSKNKNMNYAGPKSGIKTELPQVYNENTEISFLNEQLKSIPIVEEIKELDFPKYYVEYNPNTKIPEGEAIIEKVNGSFPILTFNDYKSGKGGLSDGHTAVIFTLYSGASSVVDDDRILYKCTAKNVDTLYGNSNSYPQKDYYINGDKIKISRDYGEIWIDIPISEEELSKTLEFYRLGIELPKDSYYISNEVGGTIALIYGENPKLLLSKDDGITWNDIALSIDIDNPITRRIIGFTDENNGYMALGTDWSMGTGEGKFLYITNDGGFTWSRKNIPLEGSPRTLTGLKFKDENIGILSLDPGSDVNEPILYLTEDSGDSWKEINLPWNTMPEEVQYLTTVDSLSYENGVYELTLGQGLNSNKKVVFESENLHGDRKFKEVYEAVIHYIG